MKSLTRSPILLGPAAGLLAGLIFGATPLGAHLTTLIGGGACIVGDAACLSARRALDLRIMGTSGAVLGLFAGVLWSLAGRLRRPG